MEIFGFAIMLLSIVIAWQTWRNGQLIKNMLRTIHEQGERRHREVVDLLTRMDERTVKISEQIEKMADLSARMDERLRTIHEQSEQRHREVVDLIARMDERTAKISEQIERIPEKTKRLLSDVS